LFSTKNKNSGIKFLKYKKKMKLKKSSDFFQKKKFFKNFSTKNKNSEFLF